MISDIHKVEGKYPDPHLIEQNLLNAQNEKEYEEMLSEVSQYGLASHPLLTRFFKRSFQ